MNEREHRASPSHRSYVWTGVGLGLLGGVFGMVSRGLASLELLNLAGGAAAGALIGTTLFRTRLWRRDDYAVQALRIPAAICVAGLVLSDLSLLGGLQSVAESRQALALIPGASLGFGWAIWARHFNEQRLPLRRRDLGILLSAGLGAIAWAVLVSRFSPTGAV